jgi:formylmethanofuran dehydrogenase subunit E
VAVWGSHLANPRLAVVNEKGCMMVAMSSLTSATMGAGSIDRTVLKTGKMGVTAHVEDHQGVGSAWVASQRCDNDGER